MKHFLRIALLYALGLGSLRAQDPVFSQFYTSSMFLNPALSGFEKDVVLGLNYRSQWTGVNLPFKTFQFSAMHPIIRQGVTSKQLGAFGGSAFTDESGANREMVSHGFAVASSYNFHLNRSGKHLLATALQLGVLQRRINMDALQWSSQYSSFMGYDPSLPGETFIAEQVTTPVINAGLAWRLVVDDGITPMKMYYQGAAFSNLNKPKGFFEGAHEPASILIKVHGGYLHAFRNGLELSPNYLIQYQKNVQVNVGGYAAYALPRVTSKTLTDMKVSLGFWYRIRDSFILTTGMSTSSWSAGVSYDANNSSLSREFHGANAFELSFSYRIHITKEYRRFSSPLI
jgi:type IX secretion system PorP/SprF family membrane protein